MAQIVKAATVDDCSGFLMLLNLNPPLLHRRRLGRCCWLATSASQQHVVLCYYSINVINCFAPGVDAVVDSMVCAYGIAHCGKTRKDYYAKGNFYYTNKLPIKIRVRVVNGNNKPLQTYMLDSNQSFMIFSGGITTETKANPLSFTPAIGGDTSTVIFNDTLCYSEYYRKGDVLNNIKTYESRKVSDLEYDFYYSIDSSLLKIAIKCN